MISIIVNLNPNGTRDKFYHWIRWEKKKKQFVSYKKCLLSESEIHNMNKFSIQKVQLAAFIYMLLQYKRTAKAHKI